MRSRWGTFGPKLEKLREIEISLWVSKFEIFMKVMLPIWISIISVVLRFIPMQRDDMYDHAYKISKFEKFDLFARTIIRAVLKFAHLGVREK